MREKRATQAAMSMDLDRVQGAQARRRAAPRRGRLTHGKATGDGPTINANY
jgi:hypothetical protein